jgi:hypothetical protein
VPHALESTPPGGFGNPLRVIGITPAGTQGTVSEPPNAGSWV